VVIAIALAGYEQSMYRSEVIRSFVFVLLRWPPDHTSAWQRRPTFGVRGVRIVHGGGDADAKDAHELDGVGGVPGFIEDAVLPYWRTGPTPNGPNAPLRTLVHTVAGCPCRRSPG
jgi:hypothetical protein